MKKIVWNIIAFFGPHLLLVGYHFVISWANTIRSMTYNMIRYFIIVAIINIGIGVLLTLVLTSIGKTKDPLISPIILLLSGLLIPAIILISPFILIDQEFVVRTYFMRVLLPFSTTHYYIFIGVYTALAVLLYCRKKKRADN